MGPAREAYAGYRSHNPVEAAVTMLSDLLADVVRAVACVAVGPSGLTALVATVLAGAALAAVLVLIATVARVSRTAAVLPMQRRTAALRDKSWRVAFLRQRDPGAAGRPRPRAPGAVPAAAAC
jgi:hypothetical protein